MFYLKYFFIALLMVLISSCNVNQSKDESSEFYAVPVGSILALNQTLEIAGNQVAVYVQNGVLKQYNAVDFYRPNCKFELYSISESPRSVKADRFVIIKVEDDIESSALPADTMVASQNTLLAFGALDRSYVFNYATLMYLRSENPLAVQQSDVYRMTCQHWEDIADDKHLSIKQMRQAMGELFSLTISH